ncbi:unnamed protein product [Nesidiocoris tenuis]|uniref:Uncharacterized protein n=1 Tax=Nesidiocoris tenuis TaxID=355587 RepID=A0A6H5GUZ5_9HEMI|nr:unnamed protein product [Nesidiocoris tenuis]
MPKTSCSNNSSRYARTSSYLRTYWLKIHILQDFVTHNASLELAALRNNFQDRFELRATELNNGGAAKTNRTQIKASFAGAFVRDDGRTLPADSEERLGCREEPQRRRIDGAGDRARPADGDGRNRRECSRRRRGNAGRSASAGRQRNGTRPDQVQILILINKLVLVNININNDLGLGWWKGVEKVRKPESGLWSASVRYLNCAFLPTGPARSMPGFIIDAMQNKTAARAVGIHFYPSIEISTIEFPKSTEGSSYGVVKYPLDSVHRLRHNHHRQQSTTPANDSLEQIVWDDPTDR